LWGSALQWISIALHVSWVQARQTFSSDLYFFSLKLISTGVLPIPWSQFSTHTFRASHTNYYHWRCTHVCLLQRFTFIQHCKVRGKHTPSTCVLIQ